MPIKGNKMNDVIALLTQGETKMPLPYQQLAAILEPMTHHQQWIVREEYTQRVGWSFLVRYVNTLKRLSMIFIMG